MKVYDNELIS